MTKEEKEPVVRKHVEEALKEFEKLVRDLENSLEQLIEEIV